MFLCRAICPELAGHSIALKDLTAARSARRREVRKGLRDCASVVDQLLAVHQPDHDHPAAGTAAASSSDTDDDVPAPRHTLRSYREG